MRILGLEKVALAKYLAYAIFFAIYFITAIFCLICFFGLFT
jgi:hypothetical protein